MFRIGLGFDSHPFEEKKTKPLKLGGVEIPSELSLKGHSDADVLLHAITDALLGAIAAPDIGELFPPHEITWKNADSSIFVLEALKLVEESGYKISNLDCVIICDKPKIAPYKKEIIQNLAKLLKTHEGNISIKGKTTEGFIEPNKGITVFCNVLLIKA
jgi:2-C-methyl-D-erythritol 2,4-cyclodiphosphate synthase